MLHSNHFTKYVIPTFDDLNFIKTLTNNNFPMNWFLKYQWSKDVVYFIWFKKIHPIYQTNSIMMMLIFNFLPRFNGIFWSMRLW
jgi:hypothetical protein